jgi:phosphatidylserine decarboxylase
MAFISSLKMVLAKPHRAGIPFIAGSTALAAGGLILGHGFGAAGLAATAFCLYFFRDPERVPPLGVNLALAPADGRVVLVDHAIPPPELGLGTEPRPRVAIFLSVLNVHVNRMPVSGIVSRIAYRPGKFLNASMDKASEDNERNALALTLEDGRTIAVIQIAGLIARRILCAARENDKVTAGDRFGIIRFGSRTDLYLPPGVTPRVRIGQTMIGGETVIADLDEALHG